MVLPEIDEGNENGSKETLDLTSLLLGRKLPLCFCKLILCTTFTKESSNIVTGLGLGEMGKEIAANPLVYGTPEVLNEGQAMSRNCQPAGIQR